MKRSIGFSILIFSGVLELLAGCGQVPTLGERPIAGASSYRFVEPPPSPANRPSTSEDEARPAVQYLVPRPAGPLVDPIYPRAALAAQAPRASIALRFTVDATGRVTEVRTSPVVFAVPSRFSAEFRAAAEQAVRQWRFTPAERVRVEWVRDEAGIYPNVIGREKIEWDFDVEFAFEKTGKESAAKPK